MFMYWNLDSSSPYILDFVKLSEMFEANLFALYL